MDQAIESRRKARLYFWIFRSISCLAFFIIGKGFNITQIQPEPT